MQIVWCEQIRCFLHKKKKSQKVCNTTRRAAMRKTENVWEPTFLWAKKRSKRQWIPVLSYSDAIMQSRTSAPLCAVTWKIIATKRRRHCGDTLRTAAPWCCCCGVILQPPSYVGLDMHYICRIGARDDQNCGWLIGLADICLTSMKDIAGRSILTSISCRSPSLQTLSTGEVERRFSSSNKRT